ncbi:UDP-galactose transporter [Coelomomyces lativittatus]|nr:UDP-galactose transporter [Coelomomyces lativittatus]KAJ1510270.1 UDP-galactose transporter [Coelomomyces lativittatus]KAJ1510693.1 UDP-galactose transporter [Coelomomyces lativittatus]
MSLEYLLCAIGIYVCFLTWGYLQERVSTTPYYSVPSSASTEEPVPHTFKFFVVLNFIQSITAILVGSIYLLLAHRTRTLSHRRTSHPSIPLVKSSSIFLTWSFFRSSLWIALTNALASPFGYASLQHIDYPTLILGKSCKLIPVMFLSTLLYRKTFPRYQYFSVALVTLGVTCFMLWSDKATPIQRSSSSTNSLLGLALLGINLLLDGFTNTSQERLFKKYSPALTGPHMMVTMNFLGSLLMFIYMVTPWGTQEWGAWDFVQRHPTILSDLVLFSLCGAMGQVFIFHTLSRFGSVSLVTLTVTRKMMSILISVFLYHHPLNRAQWGSVLVVFFGIAIEAYGKSPVSKKFNSIVTSPSTRHPLPSSPRTRKINGNLSPSLLSPASPKKVSKKGDGFDSPRRSSRLIAKTTKKMD